MCIGFLWHGPLFGKLWIKLVKLDATPPNTQQMQKAMLLGFLNEVVMAAGLAGLLIVTLSFDRTSALWTGVLAWVVFAWTDAANRTIWEQAPVALIGVSAGYALVKVLVGVTLFTTVPWFNLL